MRELPLAPWPALPPPRAKAAPTALQTLPAVAARPLTARPAPPLASPGDTLRRVRQGYAGAVAVAAALQLLFFWRTEANVVATLLALVSSLLGILHALDSDRFRRHPVSALILLLYATTATAGALLVKTMEAAPLVDRLQVPLATFGVLFAIQLSLLAAYELYVRWPLLQRLREFLGGRVLLRMGLMRWPPDSQLWVLGLLGCVSVLLTGTDYESDASFGFASAGTKLIRAFGFLKYAPFLIPFRDALSGQPTRRPVVPLLALGLYFLLLVGISFATNSRSTFADAIPTVGICLLLATALGRFDLKRVSPATLLTFAVVGAIAAILLSRVALAMVVVRDYRHNADIHMLVRMTLEALTNSEWLESAKARMETATTVGNYSETYVDSRFFARFLLTKFHDMVLYYFSLMGADQVAAYREFMFARLAATLPDPLLRMVGLAINKQDLVVSNGDYLIYLVDGWGLGGFKTGSLAGEVWGVFGLAMPLVVIASALLLFVFHDAFVAHGVRGRLAFSPLILLLIWNLVGTTAAFGLGAESVTAVPAGVVRGLPQNVLVFVIATALVRAGFRLAGRGSG